jgi:hypothetical protein
MLLGIVIARVEERATRISFRKVIRFVSTAIAYAAR